MFKNKRKSQNRDTLLSLRSFNAKLKLEQRRKYIDELDKLAEIDLQSIYADVAQIKNGLYASVKAPSHSS